MTETTSRATHHHGNLKSALIDYALQAAQSGTLENLSLRKASRDLGVSPGAAYRHFDDRDALLRAVAQRGFDALAADFEKVLPFESEVKSAEEAQSRFNKLAHTYVDFARQNYGLWRLMFGPYGLAPDTREKDRASTYDWLAKSLSELAQHSIISNANTHAQFFAWSAIHGLSDLQASPAIQASQEHDVVKTQCRFIIVSLAKKPE